jgi:hypothetical protein
MNQKLDVHEHVDDMGSGRSSPVGHISAQLQPLGAEQPRITDAEEVIRAV